MTSPQCWRCSRETLTSLGYRCLGTSDPEEALTYISDGKCRIILCDLKMPGMSGLTFLDRALREDPGAYVILMTGSYSIESAIEAIKHGAYDYLPKPIDRQRLKKTIGDLAEQFDRLRRIHELEQRLVSDIEFHGIVSRSPSMVDVFRDGAENLAPLHKRSPGRPYRLRKGTRSSRHPPDESGCQSTVCHLQLLGDCRYSARKPVIRARSRRLHRRHRNASRSFRIRQRRHGIPR